MIQDAAARPSCEKCGGFLYPDRHPITNRVESIKCANCGATTYRDHQRRAPLATETSTGRPAGTAHHKRRVNNV